MAVSTDLKRFLRRTAGALAEYAKQHSWNREDIELYYRWNSDWDRLHVIVVVPEFEGGSHYQAWSSILTRLAAEFADEPDAISRLGLVVRTSQQVEGGGIYSIGPPFRRVRTRKAR